SRNFLVSFCRENCSIFGIKGQIKRNYHRRFSHTPAKRPKRSTMSLDKIENMYNISLKHWENSLEECIDILKVQ
ncbi:NAD(P)-dependent oxidoreductase, partial [Escherichia coli]|uniref:NAD(P)-dependent oxidoreductase n=1 Tax=Escherichia coli TaxID=562 RepID=UPI002157ACD2